MSATPTINVWTLGRGPRGQWKLQHTTADIEEAIALCAELDGQGQQVALYELGLFEHEGRQVTGQVGFWWSANLNGYMQMEPEGRGVGWADDVDALVRYQPPAAVADDPGAEAWAGSPSMLPAMAEPADGLQPSAQRPPSALESRARRNQLLWSVFILPGKVSLWVEYMFPSKGQVWASSRRYGNPLIEVIYAGIFWAIAFIFLLAWAGNSGK